MGILQIFERLLFLVLNNEYNMSYIQIRRADQNNTAMKNPIMQTIIASVLFDSAGLDVDLITSHTF